jgi:guanylate kinase
VVTKPLVIIVSGPSGSGKSTLVEKILEVPGTIFSVSCTTRTPRGTEQPGKWYNFVTEEEFEEMVKRGEFLEFAQVFGKNRYGTPRKWLNEARERELDLVLEIDVQGAGQVKKLLPDTLSIFILPPSWDELKRRIQDRRLDTPEEIARRLQRAQQELRQYREYDYAVVNDEVERAGRAVKAIVEAARNEVRRNSQRLDLIFQKLGG